MMNERTLRSNAPLFPRLAAGFLYIAAGGVLALGLVALYNSLPSYTLLADRPNLALAPAGQVHEARLAKGTDGLLQQTAEHLSKMQRGASIGGFPGFEPPDDDEKYRRKIKEGRYSAQDINDWVKQINNFLKQIVKKNSGLSLEEILQRHGSSQAEIIEFMNALRDAEYTAGSQVGYGVSSETAGTLRSLMQALGVSTWSY